MITSTNKVSRDKVIENIKDLEDLKTDLLKDKTYKQVTRLENIIHELRNSIKFWKEF